MNTQFRPATFEVGEYSVINQVSYSDDSGEDVVTQAMCWIEVKTIGEARHQGFYCYSNEKNRLEFLNSVKKALRTARFVPAQIGSKKVSVLMPTTLIYACKDGDCKTFGMPNHSLYRKKYGILYYAPQLVINLENEETSKRFYWEKKGIQRVSSRPSAYASANAQGNVRGSASNIGGMLSTGEKLLGFFSAEISESGTVSKVKTEKKYNSKRNKLKRFKENLGEARFIPGYFNGKLVKLKTNLPYWETD